MNFLGCVRAELRWFCYWGWTDGMAFIFKLDDLFYWHASIHHRFYIWLVVLLLAGHVAKQPPHVLLVLPNMSRTCMRMSSRCNWQQMDPLVWLTEVQCLNITGIFLLVLPLQMWLPLLMMNKMYLPVLLKKKLEYCTQHQLRSPSGGTEGVIRSFGDWARNMSTCILLMFNCGEL